MQARIGIRASVEDVVRAAWKALQKSAISKKAGSNDIWVLLYIMSSERIFTQVQIQFDKPALWDRKSSKDSMK